jgi:hypothetical protein
MATLKTSALYGELQSVPLLKSLGAAYGRLKDSSRLATAGLTVLEYSCTSVLEKIYDGSKVVQGVDSLAGKGVVKLIDRYPALGKSPEELQSQTTSIVKRTVRQAMKTPPGQTLLRGLDWALDKTEALLKSIRPYRPASPRKKRTRASLAKQRLSKEHTYALDDSGACDSDTRLPVTPRDAIPAAVHKLAESEQTVMTKMFRLTCVLPLEVTVSLLKTTRRYVGGKRHKAPPGDEHDSRRKVSPRKKAAASVFDKLKYKAFGLLGYPGAGRRINLQLQDDGADKAAADDDDDERGDKKRKHEEIVTDPDSDSADDIQNFDFDAYDSEDDPDYQPSDESSESELSDDISGGETESDVEAEDVGHGNLQIKDVDVKKNVVEVKKDVNDNKDAVKKNAVDVKKDVNDNKDAKQEKKKQNDSKNGMPSKESHKAPEKPGDHMKQASVVKDEKQDSTVAEIRPEDISLRPNNVWAQKAGSSV